MWRSCVKYAKCIATPPRMSYMQFICAGGYAIYQLQHNWCIRRSCTPTATCEARVALNKSEHQNAVHYFVHTPQESVHHGDCARKSEVLVYAAVLKSPLQHYYLTDKTMLFTGSYLLFQSTPDYVLFKSDQFVEFKRRRENLEDNLRACRPVLLHEKLYEKWR
ncbi:hypothetical protein EVAR_4067_1 [Eumeta japonica]|uniref:Uncharacterized protein n=1 Tax=Eumeta variegata TaxID=151549 RepID=A0A4C1T3V9_EUMVA|nr:hypothetical protein EVAR_4067_1 [Eumeta japonica]